MTNYIIKKGSRMIVHPIGNLYAEYRVAVDDWYFTEDDLLCVDIDKYYWTVGIPKQPDGVSSFKILIDLVCIAV